MRSISPKKYLFFAVACLCLFGLTGCTEQFIGLLNPKGIIAYKERKLLFDTLALMLIVVLPVIIMSITFIYHYQISHRIRDYKPTWAHSYLLESLWWGIPCAIVVVLAVITWKSTHELDPYQPIAGDNSKPLLIQVISLPWKWLFIYPEQDIATINYLQLPAGRQVEFWLTADNSAMTAFFVPQLGSQIYAMAGMRTRLHLLANEAGVYDGMNTLYNGDGFSDMHFITHVVNETEMQQWINQVKAAGKPLTLDVYDHLVKPNINSPVQFFAGVQPNLFTHILHLYEISYGTTHPRQNIAYWHRD